MRPYGSTTHDITRRRHTRRALGVLLAAAALAGCSSTNQTTPVGSDPAVTGPAPTDTTDTTGGSDGVVSVMVIVNDTIEAAEEGPAPAEGTEAGTAALAMAESLNAGRLDGAVELDVTVASAFGVATAIAEGKDCSVLFPDGQPLPQVLIPSGLDSTSSILRCYSELGISVLHAVPTVVTSAQLENTPGLVLARGVTAGRWASAVSTTFEPSTKRVVVVEAPASFNTEPELVEAGLAEVTDALATAGLDVETFTLPDVSPDDPSYDAAMATVPTKLRRLDPDALVLPGVSRPIIPYAVLSSQQFDLPLHAGPDATPALGLFQGYAADRVHLLPAVDDYYLDIEATAVRIRTQLGESEDGARCLDAIDRDGQRASAALLYELSLQCEALLLIADVATAVPGAAGSQGAFTDAFASTNTFTLARGDQLSFAAVPQTGLSQMDELVGNPDCVCLVPSDRAAVAVP